MARALLLVLLLVSLVSVVLTFRGGHGRPLYGVIGDTFTMNNGGASPVRGFYNFGGRSGRYTLFERK